MDRSLSVLDLSQDSSGHDLGWEDGDAAACSCLNRACDRRTAHRKRAALVVLLVVRRLPPTLFVALGRDRPESIHLLKGLSSSYPLSLQRKAVKVLTPALNITSTRRNIHATTSPSTPQERFTAMQTARSDVPYPAPPIHIQVQVQVPDFLRNRKRPRKVGVDASRGSQSGIITLIAMRC
ncbi:hypothetical protein TgHK011_005686 [Trichoderma gracile]|nr:hypothetical protein TgHK011_005686 [Trichoderma gracile]